MSHPYACWPSAPGIPQLEPVPEDNPSQRAAINNHNQLEPQGHLLSSFSINHPIATSSIDAGPVSSQGHGTQPSSTAADLADYAQLPELALATSLPNNVNFEQSFMLPVPMSNRYILNHPTHATNECHDQRPNINESPTLQCQWSGCTYQGTFNRDADLWRHIKCLHLFRSHACDFPGCARMFKRKDKVREHMGKDHAPVATGKERCVIDLTV